MKSKWLMFFALLACVLPACSPVFAHHGAAAYADKIVVLKDATVTKFLWANPHNIVMFDVKDDAGEHHTLGRRSGKPFGDRSSGLEQEFVSAR